MDELTPKPKKTFYPPSQKSEGVSPLMNAKRGPSIAQRAKEGASADFAEETKKPMSEKPWRLHFAALIFILAAFIGGLYVGGIKNYADFGQVKQKLLGRESDQAAEVDFDLFWKIWSQVEKDHINQPPDYQKMLEGAINGFIYALDDPYTVYLTPSEAEEFQKELAGNFEGIGAEVGIKNNLLTIIAPLPDSPAAKAGLQKSDVILKIDDEETLDLSLMEAVSKLRGDKGTTVKLLISREDLSEAKEFVVTRDKIDVASVEWNINDQGIVYLELSQFADKTVGEMDKAISEILTKDPKGIILDLRNNTGGLLQVSVEIASEFLPADKIVAYERYADGHEGISRTEGETRLYDLPLVVLVNEGTASAAEILAGAFSDLRNVPLIGMKTFGKGTVQELRELDNGGYLRLSVAKWLTPARHDINKNGLEPNIQVDLTDEDFSADKDPQMDKALEEIKKLL